MKAVNSVVSRHSRALRILSCLQAGPSFNARELANRLKVSRRTIYRDLKLIRAAGIDVIFDERQDAYRVKTHREIAPLRLEPEDLTRLLITSHLSAFSSMSADFEASVRESMSRLLGPYPAEVRLPIQRIINCCRVRPSKASKEMSDLLQRIMVAVGRSVHIQVALERPAQRLEVIRFAPYLIEVSDSSWWVVGRNPRERNRQVLRLEDIRDVELTNIPYTIPKNCRNAATAAAGAAG
ncbi:MAG: HTH domain-containing protein [Planctomycetales bacterium]|nr:HTH domain-containing protein [Planctomycetales bacterium]